jgi:uroporphyrin-III C-methyltransferase
VTSKGKVVIVGAGPGDPELITVKGLKYVKEADVIVYDRLIPKELLREAKEGARLIYVGKEPGRHSRTQDEINEILYEEALKGNLVVRLKGGDPFVFGRGEEECLYLVSRGVECEVVPGVPSFVGASASSFVPLTNRWISSSFAVVTGTEAQEKPKKRVSIKRIAGCVDTIVVLMGARKIKEILEEVAEVRGYNERVAVIINATRRDQEVHIGSISEIIELSERGLIRNPAVIIIGNVVSLGERIREGLPNPKPRA